MMTKHEENPSAHIEVIPATLEQKPILANLLELYGHDFSEFHDIDLGPDGRFGYKCLPLYWSEPGRHPFLVRVDGRLAGFAFVKRGSEVSGDETVWDMAEFCDSWIPEAGNRNANSARGMEAVPGAVGSSRDAVERFGISFLGACHFDVCG